MAKKNKRQGPEEMYIIVHFSKEGKHDFCVCSGLSKAIESASILTDRGYKCSIAYTDEEGRGITVM